MDIELANRTLLRAKKIFDECGAPLILAQGILLGAVRENRILPWDGDIDLYLLSSVPYDNIIRAIQKIRDSGFGFWESYHIPTGKIIHWSFAASKNEVAICFKILHPAKNPDFICETGIYLGGRRPTITLLPARLFFPPAKIQFLGQTFLAPNPPEEFLVGEYNDWKTPVKNGSWMKLRSWPTFFAKECKESPWSDIIRVDEPARVEYLQRGGK